MATELDGVLAALADPTRRQVVELLRHRPRRAGELADELAMSGPAMSRHLRVLRAGGLVEVLGVDSDARVREYRLKAAAFTGLRAWLDQVEAFWSEQLGSFKLRIENGDTEEER